jgi:excisionase family DNA binding protein
MITETDPTGVQPCQRFAEEAKDFVTRLLSESERRRLLTVKEVAAQLGVCSATVYRLCDSGALLHVRIVNSIPIWPTDVATLIRDSLAHLPGT